MRRYLLAAAALIGLGGSAFAADLPSLKAPPAYEPPTFTWTGFYVGGQAGYQWGATNFDPAPYSILGETYINGFGTTPVSPDSTGLPGYNTSGFVGGGHIGYNWQVDYLVAGVEADVEGSSYSGSGSGTGSAGGPGLPPTPVANPSFSSYTTRIPIEASFRGRIGVTFDRALFYATGGGVWADVTNNFTAPSGATDSFSASRFGWTVGAGLEYAIDPNWSVRAEYRYTDIGAYNIFLANTYPGDFTNLHLVDNSVRVGFSYRFDFAPSPVVAKY